MEWKIAQHTSSGTLPLDVEPGWRTVSPWLSLVDNVRGFSLVNRAFYRAHTAWVDRAALAALRTGALEAIEARRRAALAAASEDHCAVCRAGGEVTMCDDCDRVYHARCILRPSASASMLDEGVNDDECSFMYRYILRESCSQFDSLPLTSLAPSCSTKV
jgi:hypothetical protein